MAGERGGRRQGAPGTSYANRTDLNVARAPQQGTVTAAAGGQAAPAQQQSFIPPEGVPKLDDPSARPTEPVTTGLDIGPGDGSHALGYTPPASSVQSLQAAYLAHPTPELRRALDFLVSKGAL